MAANRLTQKLRKIFVLAVFTGVFNIAMGQTNYLAQKISLSFSNITFSEALEQISSVSGVKFSYNANVVDANKIVSVYVHRESISKVLDVISEGKLRYKIVGQHIILLRKEQPVPKNKEIQYYTLSGRVTDFKTKRQLENVSVYSIGDMNSAITNEDGSYSIILPENPHSVAINYSKRDYFDTIIFCSFQKDQEVNLALFPEMPPMHKLSPMEVSIEPSYIGDLKLVQSFVSPEAIINSENLKIYENRPAQISFLPYLGSNAKVSGAITNNVSLNVISGFSSAVNGVEIGGVLNITKKYVDGVQISGFGNITGEYSRGCQVAGVLNRTMGTMVGVQVSGCANIVRDTVKGVQVSGVVNRAEGEMNGVQVSGLGNMLKGKMGGAQISGVVNYTTQNVNGIQVAGVWNIANKDVEMLQLSGVINQSKGTNKGVQVSGGLNIADTVTGLQLGIVNISDTSSGISVGLFNYVKKGYRTVEISTNEVLPINLTYKTGNYKLYNIFTAGINPWGTYKYATGLGLGTLLRHDKKLSVALELTTNQLLKSMEGENAMHLLNKLDIALTYNVAKHFKISVAPTCNVLVSTITDEDTGAFEPSIAIPMYEKVFGKTRVQSWIGAKIGVGF